jgi:hypothetical protein
VARCRWRAVKALLGPLVGSLLSPLTVERRVPLNFDPVRLLLVRAARWSLRAATALLELATFPLRLVSVRPTQEVCLSSVQSYLLTCGLRGSRHSCDSGKRFRGKVTLAAGAGSIGGGDVELAAGEAADGMQGGAVKMAGGSGSGGVVMTGGAAKSNLTAGGAVSIQGGAGAGASGGAVRLAAGSDTSGSGGGVTSAAVQAAWSPGP